MMSLTAPIVILFVFYTFSNLHVFKLIRPMLLSFHNSYSNIRLINTPHTLSPSSLSPCKNNMVHFYISMVPLPQPPLSSAMECQGHDGVTPAQEHDQLEFIQ